MKSLDRNHSLLVDTSKMCHCESTAKMLRSPMQKLSVFFFKGSLTNTVPQMGRDTALWFSVPGVPRAQRTCVEFYIAPHGTGSPGIKTALQWNLPADSTEVLATASSCSPSSAPISHLPHREFCKNWSHKKR